MTLGSLETPFAAILRGALARTPGAIGGTLAAEDGETVDFQLVLPPDGQGAWERTDWELLTAHHGVLLGHIRSAMSTFHVGEPQLLIVSHGTIHVLLRSVGGGYFALMAVEGDRAVAHAAHHLSHAATRLAEEIA